MHEICLRKTAFPRTQQLDRNQPRACGPIERPRLKVVRGLNRTQQALKGLVMLPQVEIRLVSEDETISAEVTLPNDAGHRQATVGSEASGECDLWISVEDILYLAGIERVFDQDDVVRTLEQVCVRAREVNYTGTESPLTN